MKPECDPREVTGLAEVILREDVQGLARGYSVEERLEFWNELRATYHRYIRDCARYYDRDLDWRIRGKLRLAQLLIAASFRISGVDLPDVVGKFSEKEYEALFDLEGLKEIEYLDLEQIIEMMERREGKTYEMIKTYYVKGYNMLETKWTQMIGSLALALAERYKGIRSKIEEAVIAYVRRRPLDIFIAEIEDAVRKAMEAGEERRKAGTAIEKARVEAESLEPMLAAGGEGPEAIRAREEALARLESLISELGRERERLVQMAMKLEAEVEKYKKDAMAREVLEAELEALRSRMRELELVLAEYRESVVRLRAEKEALEEKYSQLVHALEGGRGGNLVSRDDAWRLEDALVERIVRKLVGGDGVMIFDPRRGESRRVRWSKGPVYYRLHADKRPGGAGVKLVLYKGILRRRPDIVVEAVSIVHPEEYESKGWDDRPVGLGEVMEVVEDSLAEAASKDYYHIYVIGSPTGFTEKAIRLVEGGDGLSLAARNLTVYLVDLVRGTVYYNKGDPVARANAHIAEPWLPEEKVRRVEEYVLSDQARRKALANSMSRPFLLVDEIVEATGEDRAIVLRALARLSDQGAGRVKITGDGVTAFFYNTMGA